MNDTGGRIFRTFLQLVAGGALTGLVDQAVTDVPSAYAPYITLLFAFAVTLVQNVGEEFTWWGALARGSDENLPE